MNSIHLSNEKKPCTIWIPHKFLSEWYKATQAEQGLVTEQQLYSGLLLVPVSDEVRSDDLPLKLQSFELPKNLGHDVLGSTLRSNAQVPLWPLHTSSSPGQGTSVRRR